jgi:excisionase family DNA binding protein
MNTDWKPLQQRRGRYRFVHVRADGSRQPAGELHGAWREVLARSQQMVDVLRDELARGVAGAGGEVWIVDSQNDTLLQTLRITGGSNGGDGFRTNGADSCADSSATGNMAGSPPLASDGSDDVDATGTPKGERGGMRSGGNGAIGGDRIQGEIDQARMGDRLQAQERAQDRAELLPLTVVAQLAGVTPPTLHGWIQAGKLPSIRNNRRRYLRPADVAVVQAREHVDGVVPAWRADPRRAGQRVRALREAAGLSQQALAAASGVTHEAISRLETGRGTPYAETVRQLARALNVAPVRFVDEEPVGLTMLSIAEAAVRLDVPTDRVRDWVRHGHLPGTKVSGRWRVPAIAVAELERSGRLRGRSRRLDPRYRGAGAWSG